MKRFITLLLMTLTMASVNAMNYERARAEALFMTDKMTYELGLNTKQYDAVYKINLDYMLTLSGKSGYYGKAWKRRNNDMQYVLTVAQYNRYMSTTYFYRPVTWRSNRMELLIYDRYTRAKLGKRPIVINRTNNHGTWRENAKAHTHTRYTHADKGTWRKRR